MRCLAALRAQNPPDGFGQARFLTTRWSIVLSCSDSATDEEKAMLHLPNFARFTGDRFSLSSAGRGTPFLTPRI